jgi:hypothetical protein
MVLGRGSTGSTEGWQDGTGPATLPSREMRGTQMTQYPPPGPPAEPPHGPPSGPPPWPPAGAGYGAPPPSQQAGWAAYGGPQQPLQPPPWLPVHQPGVIPLRPLTLGDMFGGAFKTIRHNPGATVGVGLLVTLAFMVIPIVATVVLGAADVFPSLTGSFTDDTASASVGNLGIGLSSVVSAVFSMLAGIVVTGLVVRTVEQAALGRRITAGEAWQFSRGRVLPLLGLVLLTAVGTALLIGVPVGLGFVLGLNVSGALGALVGILGGILGVVASLVLYVRYVLLAAPVLVLERCGVFASMARAGVLSREQFWRLLGINVLARITVSAIGQVVAIPFAILGAVLLLSLPDGWGVSGMMLSSNVSTILVGGLLGPFTAGVVALQYLDQRFRKEGLDIELINRSARPAGS